MATVPMFDLTTLHSTLKAALNDNYHLSTQLNALKLHNQQLELKLAIDQSHLAAHDVILEQRANALREELDTQHLVEVNALQHQYDTLLTENEVLKQRISELEHLSAQKDHLMSQNQQYYEQYLSIFYLQLNKYQSKDAIYIAKTTIEQQSRALLVIDKLHSPLHLDSRNNDKSLTALADLTATSNALASPSNSQEVLCTRDQIRLVISGKLHELKGFGDVRWYRSHHGSAFTQIPNAGGRTRSDATVDDTYGLSMIYIPTVDDLYCTIRCQFVDPVSGATLITEVGPVVPDKELLETAVDSYKRNEVELSVLIADADIDALLEREKELEQRTKSASSVDRRASLHQQTSAPNFLESLGMGGSGGTMSDYKLTLSTKKISISGKRGNKKFTMKHNMDGSIFVSAHSDSSTGFSVYLMDMWVNCAAPNRHTRDILLALTRLFIQQARINDISTDSEKYREKQYSSSWMLSLINAEHDMATSMPKSKKLSSLQITANAQENNIGEILLQAKLASCTYTDGERFVDVTQQPFESFYEGLKQLIALNTTHVDSSGPGGDNNTSEEPRKAQQTLDIWTTQAQFEVNSLLHTQLVTIDQAVRTKPKRVTLVDSSMIDDDHTHLSFQNSAISTSSFLSAEATNTVGSDNNNSKKLSASTHDAIKPGVMKYNQNDDDYVPYDIDDVTPQIGHGKQRGFDDLVVGGDSDSDDDMRSSTFVSHMHKGGNNDEHHSSIYGGNFEMQPALQVNIKKADEVVVDNEANSTKIKQMFGKSTSNPPPTTGPSRRRAQQMSTLTPSSTSAVAPVSTPTYADSTLQSASVDKSTVSPVTEEPTQQ